MDSTPSKPDKLRFGYSGHYRDKGDPLTMSFHGDMRADSKEEVEKFVHKVCSSHGREPIEVIVWPRAVDDGSEKVIDLEDAIRRMYPKKGKEESVADAIGPVPPFEVVQSPHDTTTPQIEEAKAKAEPAAAPKYESPIVDFNAGRVLDAFGAMPCFEGYVRIPLKGNSKISRLDELYWTEAELRKEQQKANGTK